MADYSYQDNYSATGVASTGGILGTLGGSDDLQSDATMTAGRSNGAWVGTIYSGSGTVEESQWVGGGRRNHRGLRRSVAAGRRRDADRANKYQYTFV